MNLRFPEIFGIMLLGATVCSFGLSRARSAPIENTFQFIYAPVAGPIQWVTSTRNVPVSIAHETPLLPEIREDVARLQAEKLELQVFIEQLQGQLDTLRHRAAQTERIGERLRDNVVAVKVISAEGSGRDVVRLQGSSTSLVIEPGAPVITDVGIVGRVTAVGMGNQTSARLITDKGFKLLAKFARYVRQPDGTFKLEYLPLDETLVEGNGNKELRIESLRKADIARSGLKVTDLVLLSDVKSLDWPIEVHGYRIGAISYIGDRLDTTGVAEVRVRPEQDLMGLKDVWILGKKQ